ncbi:MAG: hypothetical protein ACPHID_07685 [Thermoplasmatota archaeon]
MEERLRLGDCDLHLIGSIPGFVPDGARVQTALDEGHIQCVALGIPPEDLEGLAKLHEGATIEAPTPKLTGGAAVAAGAPGLEGIHDVGKGHVPTAKTEADFEALDPTQERFLEHLTRWGETRIPSPDLEVAFSWAAANNRRIEALDLDDELHAHVYIHANKFRHVLKSGRILKRIVKESFDDVEDAHEFAVAWDAYLNQLPSLQAVEEAREAEMAKRLQDLSKVHDSIVAVIPAARFEAIARALKR